MPATCSYHARVELSSKVVDSYERLRATLLHELCHAAAWLLDHKAKPPHGEHFQHWADRCAPPPIPPPTPHTSHLGKATSHLSSETPLPPPIPATAT